MMNVIAHMCEVLTQRPLVQVLVANNASTQPTIPALSCTLCCSAAFSRSIYCASVSFSCDGRCAGDKPGVPLAEATGVERGMRVGGCGCGWLWWRWA
jgi:hypothetical protein